MTLQMIQACTSCFFVSTKSLQGITRSFTGLACAREFTLHFRRPKYRKAVFIVHSSKWFDGYIILNAMIELGLKPSITMQDRKVICIHEQDFDHKYIDSLSFLSMPFTSMPKVLGFENKVKGYFPHQFCCEANSVHLKCTLLWNSTV